MDTIILNKNKTCAQYKATLTKSGWSESECIRYINGYGREAFFYAMALLNPQKAHPILEKLFKHLDGVKNVMVKDARGDYLNRNGKYVERKSSFSLKDENDKKIFNIVQIRPFQKIDLYSILFVEFFPNVVENLFEIDADKFYGIVGPYWAVAHTSGNATHGCRPSLEETITKRIEMRISVEKSGRVWNEFSKYRVGSR